MNYFEPPNRLPTVLEADQMATRGARFEVVIDSALGSAPSAAHWRMRPRTPLGRLPSVPTASTHASLLAVLAIEQRKGTTRTGHHAVRHASRLLALSARGNAQAALRAHALPTLAEIVAHTFEHNSPKQLERILVRHMHTQCIHVAPEACSLDVHLLRALALHTPTAQEMDQAVSAAQLIAHLVAHAIDWSRHHDATQKGAPE